MRTASVIIPTYRNTDLLAGTLQSLCSQSIERSAFEILVADNNATDDWERHIREICDRSQAVYLRVDAPGAGAARAAAVDAATGEIAIFVDDDVECPRDFLASHLRYHERDDQPVVLGAVKSVVRSEPWFERYLRRSGSINMPLKPGETPRPGQFYGANASASRRAILAVGNFDPAFRRRQDSELGYRLRTAGYPFVAAPEIVVTHSVTCDPGGYIRRGRKNGYFLALFHEKHPETVPSERTFWLRNAWTRHLLRIGGGAALPFARALEPLAPGLVDRSMNARILAEIVAGYRDFRIGFPPPD